MANCYSTRSNANRALKGLSPHFPTNVKFSVLPQDAGKWGVVAEVTDENGVDLTRLMELATKVVLPKKEEPADAAAPKEAKVKKEIRLGPKRPDGLREGSAAAKLVDYVCEKGEDDKVIGRTNAELCKHVGWLQCLPALRAACERAKIKLVSEKKEGDLTKYYGYPRKKRGPKTEETTEAASTATVLALPAPAPAPTAEPEAKPLDQLGDLSTQGTGLDPAPVEAGHGEPLETLLATEEAIAAEINEGAPAPVEAAETIVIVGDGSVE